MANGQRRIRIVKAVDRPVKEMVQHQEGVATISRFEKRLENPEKHWKLNIADYTVRERWDEYREAYEDVFQKCNQPDAPWFVIPADNKWYRDAAVAGITRDTLRAMDPQMPAVEVDLDEIRQCYEILHR